MTVADKAAALTLGGLAPLLSAIFTNDLTTPVLGVGVTTVVGAVLGTAGALGYDDERPPRGRMFARTLATVIIASLVVGAIPRWLGWTWSSGPAEAALCGLTAVVVYYLLPPAIQRGREMIRDLRLADFIPWMRKRPETPAKPPDPPKMPEAPADPPPPMQPPEPTQGEDPDK